ncbi:unnamed protein product [Cuscuta campestris]|uniref:Uncharacterized protein n=1 Tax=Cuscuta campestris TaxID=132261 RepID=A0A484MQP2_9ASTE|nr:unnamed protein product [Cuscuta campestris]
MVSSGGAQKWRPGDGGSTAKRLGQMFSDHLTISEKLEPHKRGLNRHPDPNNLPPIIGINFLQQSLTTDDTMIFAVPMVRHSCFD